MVGAGFYEINAKPASTKVGVEIQAELGNNFPNVILKVFFEYGCV